MNTFVPSLRIQKANRRPVEPSAAHVVYWMVAARRRHFNFGLQRAADWARELGLPLLVLEAVRIGYPWASDRLHRFILDGMADNAAGLRSRGVTYLPYVEPELGAGSGLLEALAADAAIIVTDTFPTFFLPRMVASAARRAPVLMESIDSNGLIPLAATGQAFATAYAFRRWIQKHLADHLDEIPLEDPLAEELPPPTAIPGSILDRWPAAPTGFAGGLSDHPCRAPHRPRGGSHRNSTAARLRPGESSTGSSTKRLTDYGEKRNRPDDGRSSGLSPYLHFGHISAHEVFLEVMRRERWSPEDVVPPANGRRAGWWGVSETRRGLSRPARHLARARFPVLPPPADHDRWRSLPDWARRTLELHAADTREHLYIVGRVRRGRHPRPAVERGPDPARP